MREPQQNTSRLSIKLSQLVGSHEQFEVAKHRTDGKSAQCRAIRLALENHRVEHNCVRCLHRLISFAGGEDAYAESTDSAVSEMFSRR